MSIVRSFCVGNGDMFCINHGSDSFTIIDCCLSDGDADGILAVLKAYRSKKAIARFISTHPDDDHIRGIELLKAQQLTIENFYCVDNSAMREDETGSFKAYCTLRDDAKTFHLSKGCSRKWLNEGDSERGQAGITILWPDVNNAYFKDALAEANAGLSPNNISPVIKYSLQNGASAIWMGDLETDFMDAISNAVAFSHVDVIFAPHHGRDSGRIPDAWLKQMSPRLIVVGEAPSEHLHYYPDYNTITQNSAGEIFFNFDGNKIHVFTGNEYNVDFLVDEAKTQGDFHYVGSLTV